MEINKDNFSEVIGTDAFKAEILPLITGIESVKTMIDNKADSIYKGKIDDEVKNIYSRIDEDIFSVLNERPGQKEDGNREKTYEFVKRISGRLKELEGQKDSLTKDAEVQRLNSEIERLKNEGGGKHVQSIFDQAKIDWAKEKESLTGRVTTAEQASIDFRKTAEIDKAINELKFDPTVSESVKKMILSNTRQNLIKNSKFEEGKLVFLKDDGKPSLNGQYEAMTASEMIGSMETIKDITIQGDKGKGGGADTKIVGSVKITSVEGKNTKTLILPDGLITSKTIFAEEADKALIASGVKRGDPEWLTLRAEAHTRLNVKDLPR